VCVENGKYLGFGFIDITCNDISHDTLRACICSYQDNRDVQQIIKGYLRNGRVERVVAY
jgi:DNA polymerase-3 subunit epsilon